MPPKSLRVNPEPLTRVIPTYPPRPWGGGGGIQGDHSAYPSSVRPVRNTTCNIPESGGPSRGEVEKRALGAPPEASPRAPVPAEAAVCGGKPSAACSHAGKSSRLSAESSKSARGSSKLHARAP